jgi:hypothetical protein
MLWRMFFKKICTFKFNKGVVMKKSLFLSVIFSAALFFGYTN